MKVPDHLRYTKDHEWVEQVGERRIRVGITDYAQDALGDVVYVQAPQLEAEVATNGLLAEVESTKSVAEVYAPLAGKVVARNDALSARPELLNQDPYGEGWFCEIEISDDAALGDLLTSEQYRQLTE